LFFLAENAYNPAGFSVKTMTTLMQWIHLMAGIVGLGGMGFILLILMPSLGVLGPEQREALFKAVSTRFRWVSWSAMGLLVITGLYNVRQYYWEMAWGRTWLLLTLKIGLAFTLFGIILALTLPLGIFDRVRARRRSWLIAAFALGVVIVLISAYLRSRG
jgi:uncharacterized membrane protein